MAHVKWVVDQAHPAGYAVPMTPEEEAQLAADQAAWAAIEGAEATRSANAQTVRDTLVNRMAQLRQARTALSNGNIFAAMSANEKAVIDGLLADNIYLARLTLSLYDGTA